jgi:hypothetical protein
MLRPYFFSKPYLKQSKSLSTVALGAKIGLMAFLGIFWRVSVLGQSGKKWNF